MKNTKPHMDIIDWKIIPNQNWSDFRSPNDKTEFIEQFLKDLFQKEENTYQAIHKKISFNLNMEIVK